MADYSKTILRNGLRILLVPEKTAKAVTVLVVVGAGSKYETKAENGLSHFLEHMFFKGTKKRPNTLKISETLDNVGGAYNAFTSKELTGYWAKTAKEHFDLALDWVSDIFLHSKLESKEIKKEKGVILEEINMRLDTPMHYIGDLWEKLLYGDQPAGWETIGQKENILRFQRKDFTNYLKNHYSSLNTIICISGNFSQRDALEKVRKYFKPIGIKPPKQKVEAVENQKEPKTLPYFKKTDQTHLCLGVRGYNLFDSEIYAQEALSVMLGGNMSSRLFIEIREKRGLAYYVRTSVDGYTDTGYLCCNAGVNNTQTEQVIELIIKEFKNMRDKKISQKELNKAKDYLKGSLVLGLESSDAKASFYAGQELLTGRILTPQQKCVKIDEISLKDVKKVAKNIFKPEKLNLALIGPHKDKQKFQNLLKL